MNSEGEQSAGLRVVTARRQRMLWVPAVVGAGVLVVFGLVAVGCGVALVSFGQWALAWFPFVVAAAMFVYAINVIRRSYALSGKALRR
ncbi:hypothetical protein [Nocardia sp. NPDC056100]|uniref:hypothetical protein n=1 Tax=Nocardia sp. NPDC056100 TaxID=3345712 RepID=UPI0035D54D52